MKTIIIISSLFACTFLSAMAHDGVDPVLHPLPAQGGGVFFFVAPHRPVVQLPGAQVIGEDEFQELVREYEQRNRVRNQDGRNANEDDDLYN